MSQDLSNLVAAFSSNLRFQDSHVPTHSGKHDSVLVKMKGLPFTASKADIEQFFAGFVLKDVQFVFEPDGRQSGLAFAEFESTEEAARALSKNGEYIGTRYIKLLLVSRDEMEHSLRHGSSGVPFPSSTRRTPRAVAPQSTAASFLPQQSSLSNWPNAAAPDRYVPSSATLARRPFRPVQPASQLTWSGGLEMHAAPVMPMLPQRPLMVAPEPLPGPALGTHIPLELLEMQGGANFTFSPLSNTRTLRIRGLPYTVRPDEVISFFDGLNALADTLQFAYDPMGRFTGDAWISFATPENALEALKQKNRHYLRNRYLELSLC